MFTLLVWILAALIIITGGCDGGGGGGGDNDALSDESVTGTTIGSGGGTVTSNDGKVTVSIPSDALSGDTSIAITPLATTPSGGIGTAYRFLPEGTTFAKPVTISIGYNALDLPISLDESTLALATRIANHQWREMVGSSSNTTTDTVSGNTYSFSTYGLKISGFEINLDGQQVVPSTPTSATGKARFDIDCDTNILAYHISYSSLDGTETSAAIHGPANPGATAAVLQALASANPKIGIWKFDESHEADLLSGKMYIRINTDLYTNGEIRGQITPSAPSTSLSDVMVRIHQWDDASGNGPISGIPALVDSVDITISAPDMTLLSNQADLSTGNVAETVSVPKGSARQIEALAYDVSDQLIFNGYAYVDIFDKDHVINLSMVSPTDTTSPTFAGLVNAQKFTTDAVRLSWSPATDDTASSMELYYLIYAAKSSGAQNFSSPHFVTDPGETFFTIQGLAAGTTYYFVVRTMDTAGNMDTNNVEVSVATFSNGTGLYVDVNTGQDDVSCGNSDDPCKTITYALTKTAGNENIHIAKGLYDTTSGESFPLTLKSGTALLGELVFVQTLPTTAGNVLRGTLVPASVIRIDHTTNTSAIMGADNTTIAGILVDFSPSLTNSHTAVDGRENNMRIYWSALYGAPGANSSIGLRIGTGSIIKRSLFSDFTSSAINSYQGAITVSHNNIKNSGHGVTAVDSHIYRNYFTNNSFGISPRGVDSRIYLNVITGNYNGIDQPGSGTIIQSNKITNNDGYGINASSAVDLVDPLVISNNWIVNNDVAGIRVLNKGNAVIKGNVVVCNKVGIFSDRITAQLDVRYNKWDHNPPTIFDYNESDICNDADLCYTGTYALTPMPLYLPTNGTDSCPGTIGIMPAL